MAVPHYAVFGSPVAHSLSPRIHAAFARQCGIALIYVPLDTAEVGFAATFERFAAAGGIGANVTAPDKAAAASVCARLSSRAQRAGVVNTLALTPTGWQGDTTDGIGLVRDLRERRDLGLYQARVLLVGAGGAARSVAPALLDADIAQLVVANRTRATAYDLIDALDAADRVRACTPDEVASQGAFDLVIHAATPADDGAQPDLPGSILADGATVVDLNYGARALPMLAWAARNGCARAFDGLGMLVEQAAESFELWHGMRPDTDPVYAQLRLSGRTATGV